MAKQRVAENPVSKPVISIIKIGGYIDITTSEELSNAIDALLNSNQFNIIIDLNEVAYISSYGWSIFLSKIKEIRENDGDLKLARMQSDVYEVFKLLEFFWFLNSYENLEDAVADFDTDKRPLP